MTDFFPLEELNYWNTYWTEPMGDTMCVEAQGEDAAMDAAYPMDCDAPTSHCVHTPLTRYDIYASEQLSQECDTDSAMDAVNTSDTYTPSSPSMSSVSALDDESDGFAEEVAASPVMPPKATVFGASKTSVPVARPALTIESDLEAFGWGARGAIGEGVVRICRGTKIDATRSADDHTRAYTDRVKRLAALLLGAIGFRHVGSVLALVRETRGTGAARAIDDAITGPVVPMLDISVRCHGPATETVLDAITALGFADSPALPVTEHGYTSELLALVIGVSDCAPMPALLEGAVALLPGQVSAIVYARMLDRVRWESRAASAPKLLAIQVDREEAFVRRALRAACRHGDVCLLDAIFATEIKDGKASRLLVEDSALASDLVESVLMRADSPTKSNVLGMLIDCVKVVPHAARVRYVLDAVEITERVARLQETPRVALEAGTMPVQPTVSVPEDVVLVTPPVPETEEPVAPTSPITKRGTKRKRDMEEVPVVDEQDMDFGTGEKHFYGACYPLPQKRQRTVRVADAFIVAAARMIYKKHKRPYIKKPVSVKQEESQKTD